MKNPIVFVIAIVLLIVLLAYSMFYPVRFDQTAVVTQFGKADDSSVINAGDVDQSGLHFKLPTPIATVHTYDKRVQVLEDRPEEQQTLDNVSVVLQIYLAWRITNPLDFYRALGTVENAEQLLRDKLRDARKIVGAKYTFSDLANSDREQLRLDELEKEILTRMQADLAKADPAKAGDERPGRKYGVEIKSVGIKRVLLAPKTTEEVFNRMKKTRERLAQSYRSEGEQRAEQIKAEAAGMKKTILTFAEARAKELQSQGEQAATQYIKVFEQDPEFAEFLQKLDAIREMFRDTGKGKTTFVFDSSNPLFEYFQTPPGTGDKPVKAAAPAKQPIAKTE